MSDQLTIRVPGVRRLGRWLLRIVVVAVLLAALGCVISWAVRPRDGIVHGVASSHYVSVQLTNGTTLYGHLRTAHDPDFLRLTSVRALSTQSAASGHTGLALTSQRDTYVDRQQILDVVDIGTNPPSEQG